MAKFDPKKPVDATFTDKDPQRGTWSMHFDTWLEFNAYVGQKINIIASYELEPQE